MSCRSPSTSSLSDRIRDLPDEFSRTQVGEPVAGPWWLDFQSPELNALILHAFSGNLSLAETEARLRQSVAEARKAGASVWPDLAGNATVGDNRIHKADVLQDLTARDYSLGLAASYELDLWGRVRESRRIVSRQAEASRFDLETAAITLAGSVAEIWVRILEQNTQIHLLVEQIRSIQRTLDLLKLRQLKGQANALDVYQQAQIAAATEALLPQARAEARILRTQLALLLGRARGAPVELTQAELPTLPDLPDLGLPADLLIHRPDVRAALSRIEAAESGVRVAQADRLPAIRLTGRAAFNSDSVDSLFDNWILNLAAGLTAPLLDGGRRTAEAERTRAVTDERLAQYRRVALTAFSEVENALARDLQIRDQLAATERQLQFSRQALRESETRYGKGALEYLPVLTALSAVQRLERSVLSLHRDRLIQRIALYRALGGRWTDPESGRPVGSPSRPKD
ncbi:MAG: efflux transporter outer membrane subunit [Kiritimatiellia bacterium]|nr:efflux transporter outer membrane subunit [Kiritimatiellia bacterium]